MSSKCLKGVGFLWVLELLVGHMKGDVPRETGKDYTLFVHFSCKTLHLYFLYFPLGVTLNVRTTLANKLNSQRVLICTQLANRPYQPTTQVKGHLVGLSPTCGIWYSFKVTSIRTKLNWNVLKYIYLMLLGWLIFSVWSKVPKYLLPQLLYWILYESRKMVTIKGSVKLPVSLLTISMIKSFISVL